MKIGPWPLGLDNISPDVGVSTTALKQAVNVLIDRDGTVDSFGGWINDLSGSISHAWQSESGRSFALREGQIINLPNQSSIDGIEIEKPIWFADHASQVCVIDRLGVCRVGDSVEELALPTPERPVATASPNGGLNKGRYGVAASSIRRGEEFGLSPVAFVDVEQGGGIEIQVPVSDYAVHRIYRTNANGSELYRVTDAPSGMSYLVGAGKLGAMSSTQYLDPLPSGHLLASWNSRLLCATGRTLVYSQPFRSGLHDRRHNFVKFKSRIRMIAPIDTGVYVADSTNVYFLRGENPDAWEVVIVGVEPPPEGCFIVANGGLFPDIPSVKVAVWLSQEGFVIGLPDAQVIQPQASRISINLPDSGRLTVFNRRLYALAQ